MRSDARCIISQSFWQQSCDSVKHIGPKIETVIPGLRPAR